MKILTLFLIITITVSVSAQQFIITYGRTSFNLSEQKKEFTSVVHDFNKAYPELNIPIQTLFPENHYPSIGLLFDANSSVSFGAQLSFGRTNAYALYEDIIGRISFKSSFSTTMLGLVIKKHLPVNDEHEFSVSSVFSLGKVIYSFSWNVKSQNSNSSGNSDSITRDDLVLFCMEPGLEYTFKIHKKFSFVTHIGYRIGGSTNSKNNDQFDNIPYLVEKPTEININPDGYVISIGIAINLEDN